MRCGFLAQRCSRWRRYCGNRPLLSYVLVCRVCRRVALVLNSARAQDPRLELIICGSYRRGLPDCGDVDVLITHPDFVR